MTPDEQQQNKLRRLGDSILRALETIAGRATNLLGRPGHGTGDVLAVDANPMTGAPLGRRSVGHARAETRRDLQRIAREPFVARVDLEWMDDDDGTPTGHEIIYVTRGSASDLADAIPGARVVSYQAPLGRIAEFAAGEYAQVASPGQYREAAVQQRIRVRPVHREGQWDGRDGSFEFDTWSAALDSIRAFLDQLDRTVEPLDVPVPDIIGELLDEADTRTQVREALRRQVVDRMLLRDQPVLDRYQGEVFRMPINCCLLLLGAPGTGKTTTLIKRLAQKRSTDGLTEKEEEHLDRMGLLSAVQDPSSWVMFSPTELLQLYLRDAFNKEGVPADAGNLKTWDRQRLALGKNVLRVLRTADSGRFRLDETADPLADRTSSGVTALQEQFEGYFNEAIVERARESVRYLRSRGSEVVNRVLDDHLASIESGQATSPRQLVGILDLAGLQPELQKLQEDTGAELKRMGNVLVRSHRQLLDGVRLFFVEKFSPYSWAFLPADASLQCSVRGDSNQASTYPRLSGGQPSLETVPNTVGLSPSGGLPSGHSRGVLVRFHGQGDRPVMAVTTGFQGRRFDVPEARTGVPRIDLPSPAPCAAADAVFADAKAFLSSNEARQMSESELERELHRRGQKLVRKLLQGHHDQRSPGQVAGPAEDASGVECSARREQDSHAETTSGTMQVVGLGCARRGHDGLHPLDAALNLLPERSLVDMRRRVTIATASRAPPRTPWKPQWYSTLSTWQRRCGVRCSSPSSLKACRHLARDRMVVDRRTVTLGCSCDGPQAATGRRRIDAY